MKTLKKRIVSLILVGVMLVAMIPAGIISVGGLDYSKSEFSVANLADWNAIASCTENFSGKTVKLTASFDAGGATLSPLFTTFAGTFDGQGYTISNFKVAGSLIATKTTAGAVIKNVKISSGTVNSGSGTVTGLLVGEHDGTGSLTVTDCSITATVTSANKFVGGAIGQLSLNDGTSATLKNISLNVTVSSTAASLSNAWQGAGGLIGFFSPAGKVDLTVQGIKLAGSVTTKTGTVGGLIGSMQPPSGQMYAGGSVTIANCKSTAIVTSYDSTADNGIIGAGGLIGSLGVLKYYVGDNYVFLGKVQIKNCAVGGSVSHTVGSASGAAKMGVGGVIGSIGISDVSVAVDHCVVSATFPKNDISKTDGTGGAIILGYAGAMSKTSMTVNNTVTTATGVWSMVGAITAKQNATNNAEYYPWLYINGKDLAKTAVTAIGHTNNITTNSYYITTAYSDSSIATVSATAAASMVKANASGFVTRVGGQLTAFATQKSAQSTSGFYALRFIAISQIDSISSARMQVVVRDAATGMGVKKFTADCTLYDGLNAYDSNGTKIDSYSAKDFGGKKFVALIIRDIPMGKGYTYEVIPSYTQAGGLKMEGNPMSVTYDASANYLAELSGFDVTPLPSGETSVRVMSSNVLSHADSHADDTGLTTTERLKRLANAYLFYDPDFIGLQEMNEDTDGGNGAAYYYKMQTELMQYIGSKYTMVNVSSKLAASQYWTPIVYRTDRWTLVEWDVDTAVVNNMFRWTWALYQSKSDPSVRFIHMNLHGPNGNYEAQKPAYFAEINALVKELTAKYPEVAIAITGDYNLNMTLTHFSTMTEGTSLVNSMTLAKDTEKCISSGSNRSIYDVYSITAVIDHVMVTSDRATVLKQRVVRNTVLGAVSDHCPIYVDLTIAPKSDSGTGNAMSWASGVTKYGL